MPKHQKSWKEKLLNTKSGKDTLPKIEEMTDRQRRIWGAGNTILIPAPIEVDELMRKVPKGKLTTINSIRDRLAYKHKADMTCPIVTGISAWISSFAAEEERDAGKKRITPYWRTLKSGGELNPKYPGGISNQAKLLKQEGHKLLTRGKRSYVENFEKKMFKM